MIKIIGKRCTGKTTKLIGLTIANNAILIVPSEITKRTIINTCSLLKNKVYTCNDIRSGRHFGTIYSGMFIDELDSCLNFIRFLDDTDTILGYSISTD